MLVHEHLRQTAASLPDKTALIVGRARYSFGEIDAASCRLAAEFQRLGVGRGDRVAVMLENSAEMVVAMWAVLKAGAVFVPVSTGTRSDKLGFLLADAGARCLVAPDRLGFAAAVANAPTVAAVVTVGPDGFSGLPDGHPTDPGLIDQDLCFILYTSGSTGRPKGVMMTHAAIANTMWAISTYLGNQPDDVALCVLPLFFDYGLFQILTGARVGFTVVLERSFAYPWDVLKRIAEHRVTILPGVPTIFATLLQFAPFDGLDLGSLRTLTNTAAPFPPAHIRRLRALLPGARIFSMYGLTECTRVSFLDPARLEDKIGTVGRAMPNCETFILDEQGNRCPPGMAGELVVRGANLMRGYWRRPEETAAVLKDGEIPGEKTLYTGDLFRMDEDGDLTFVGRRDDVFKCRGEKVSPREIENVLYEMEDVAEAGVIGTPDPIDGMAITACVVPRPGRQLDVRELRRHCMARLEARLVPSRFEIADALPKTESGKITKTRLRAEMATAAVSTPAAE